MQLVDSIEITKPDAVRSVQLSVGDLSDLPAGQEVDAIVVSAFPDDYTPTSSSLIGALEKRGVSLNDLASRKAVDLRKFSSCWLSEVIDSPDVHFDRILCFEPACRGKAPELVGDIFRSIIPFTTGEPPISRITMPLVASGDQAENPGICFDDFSITSARAE